MAAQSFRRNDQGEFGQGECCYIPCNAAYTYHAVHICLLRQRLDAPHSFFMTLYSFELVTGHDMKLFRHLYVLSALAITQRLKQYPSQH